MRMIFRVVAMPRRRTNRLIVPCPSQAAVSMAPHRYHSLSAIGLKVNSRMTSVSAPIPYSTNPMLHNNKCAPCLTRKRLNTAAANTKVMIVVKIGR